jgi:hypothetical protein
MNNVKIPDQKIWDFYTGYFVVVGVWILWMTGYTIAAAQEHKKRSGW